MPARHDGFRIQQRKGARRALVVVVGELVELRFGEEVVVQEGGGEGGVRGAGYDGEEGVEGGLEVGEVEEEGGGAGVCGWHFFGVGVWGVVGWDGANG